MGTSGGKEAEEMTTKLTREQGLELLKSIIKSHSIFYMDWTVEGTMKWFAKELGYGG